MDREQAKKILRMTQFAYVPSGRMYGHEDYIHKSKNLANSVLNQKETHTDVKLISRKIMLAVAERHSARCKLLLEVLRAKHDKMDIIAMGELWHCSVTATLREEGHAGLAAVLE
eukprot:116174-Rhodomonas_salina.1